MDTLRVILIIIGIIFIAGLYFFQTKKAFLKNLSSRSFLKFKNIYQSVFKSTEDSPPSTNRSREQLSSEQLLSMNNMIASKSKKDNLESDSSQASNNQFKMSSQKTNSSQASTEAKGDEFLITLMVLPKPGNTFTGSEIITACKEAGMQLGEYNIFHRYALVDNKVLMTPVCSLVNLFEPGYFELDSIEDFTTEGLSLFMQLPGPVDGRDAFIILMDVSDKLSLNLNATICDETRSVLTTQTISHLKEKVENYRFKLKMDLLKNH